ncbi:MAG: hypothetical protein CM15mP3_08690 [Candidatus Poseidoniales archaeon]|nr:MAG: hypothetical protein CM15mP3_08690 [Candidatus Poseidoniales archaeon]
MLGAYNIEQAQTVMENQIEGGIIVDRPRHHNLLKEKTHSGTLHLGDGDIAQLWAPGLKGDYDIFGIGRT